jgi:hypothetical protein
MSDNSITVPWPPLALGEAGWRRRLEDLAGRAESLVGRYCTLQQTTKLALELVGLTWQAIGPETIAATCRASLLLGQPVIMGWQVGLRFDRCAGGFGPIGAERS